MKTFLLGLLVTLGGVGGIETAQTAVGLVQSAVVCSLGLTLMYVGTYMLAHAEA